MMIFPRHQLGKLAAEERQREELWYARQQRWWPQHVDALTSSTAVSGVIRGNLGMLWVEKTCFRNVTLCSRIYGNETLLGVWGPAGGSWDYGVNRFHILGKLKLTVLSPVCWGRKQSPGRRLQSTELEKSFWELSSCLQGIPELWQLLGWVFQWWHCFPVIPAPLCNASKNPLAY